MKRYEVIAPFVLIHAGALQLTDEQALSRKGFLTRTKKKGVYLVDVPTGFKRGELIGFDGEIDRSLMLDLAEKKPDPREEIDEKKTSEGNDVA